MIRAGKCFVLVILIMMLTACASDGQKQLNNSADLTTARKQLSLLTQHNREHHQGSTWRAASAYIERADRFIQVASKARINNQPQRARQYALLAESELTVAKAALGL